MTRPPGSTVFDTIPWGAEAGVGPSLVCSASQVHDRRRALTLAEIGTCFFKALVNISDFARTNVAQLLSGFRKLSVWFSTVFSLSLFQLDPFTCLSLLQDKQVKEENSTVHQLHKRIRSILNCQRFPSPTTPNAYFTNTLNHHQISIKLNVALFLSTCHRAIGLTLSRYVALALLAKRCPPSSRHSSSRSSSTPLSPTPSITAGCDSARDCDPSHCARC
ncbi:hypothetical protein IF1G_04608 [Cordyceps javanica]|uniref:Uncharacterized protein n=1 Tax=Cordyceps javanica TaxID=43265 RepID=A0A545V6N0_9HYPO|nr:hypothetical protein IF1G_04608 [Cordyceps javanica]